MLSLFKKPYNYQGSEPPDETISTSKAAGKILFAYFAITYIFSYYLNNVCSCQITNLPGPLQSVLDFLFTLFLNDLNNGLIHNINCFKTVLVFVALLTILYIFVYWHFEKKRLIKRAEKGILNNDYNHKISYLIMLGFIGFILMPYILILNVDPKPGPRPGHHMIFILYNDINHWVPQATRAFAPFSFMSFTLLESWAQIIARKNMRQQKG